MIAKIIFFLSIWLPTGALIARLSIRLWTKKNNPYWIAAMLFPYTVLMRKNWDTHSKMMQPEFGNYGCTIYPFVYDLLIGDNGGMWSKIYYFALHSLFWPVRIILNTCLFSFVFILQPACPPRYKAVSILQDESL